MRAASTLMLLLFAGCGATTSCPNDLPANCPATPPSWKSQVSFVVATNCAVCHGPNGVEAARPLVTYADVYARRTAVLSQVYACHMPPLDMGGPLIAEDRAVLLQWLVCGAPDT